MEDLNLMIAIEKTRQSEHDRLIKIALATGEVPDYALQFPPFRQDLKLAIDKVGSGQYTRVLWDKIRSFER